MHRQHMTRLGMREAKFVVLRLNERLTGQLPIDFLVPTGATSENTKRPISCKRPAAKTPDCGCISSFTEIFFVTDSVKMDSFQNIL